MKLFLLILTIFLFIPNHQTQAQVQDRPGIPTVLYTYVVRDGVLIRQSAISCNGDKNYNCFDLVSKDDKPAEYLKPIEMKEIEDVRLVYIKDGIKFEEVGTLKRFEDVTKGGQLSSYIIEMAVK